MRIGDAMKQTGLTRKAIHFYESVGLIHPDALENGYRDYSDADVRRLRTIAALRQADLPLERVREALEQPQRAEDLLRDHLACLEGRRQRIEFCAESARRLLQRLQAGAQMLPGDIGQALGDRLRGAFPGGFGALLAAHFRPFLNAPIDTQAKQQAAADMIAYLDELEIELPELLGEETDRQTESVQQGFWVRMEELRGMPQEEQAELLRDLRRRKREMDRLLMEEAPETFRQLTDAAAQLSAALNGSGYYDRVVKNMRAISPAYHSYLEDLRKLEERMDADPA